jgi:hypothetical protein
LPPPQTPRVPNLDPVRERNGADIGGGDGGGGGGEGGDRGGGNRR